MFSPNAQALVALLLLGLSLPALAHIASHGIDTWRGRPEARWLLGAIGVAAVLRWVIAPLRIATMYIGYLLTEQVIELQPDSHYGIGSQALYHALFAVLPHDHRSLMAVNAVVGVMVVPVVATLAARAFDDHRTGLIAAWFVAVIPLFVRNDTSDANNVPWLLWFGAGLIALLAALDRPTTLDTAAATILLTLAAISRPEMPLLVPALVVVFALGTRASEPWSRRIRSASFWVALVVFALCVLPHALHVREATALLETRGSLPGTNRGTLWAYVRIIATRNTLLDPGLYPIGCVVTAVLALTLGTAPMRTRLAWMAMAVLSLLPYTLDLCRANMARVHVPAALWFTVLAGHGVASVWKRRDARVAAALAVGVALSALPTIRVLWAPTNEEAEEAMIRASFARLPAEATTLVRIDRIDRDRNAYGTPFTHDHFPDYLLRPPVREGRASSITDWIGEPDFTHPAYFYLGMRCYAEFREEGTPPPHGQHLQRACERMRREFVLEPVIERDVVNRGDVWLAYYGDAPTFRLGLYRIVRRAGATR